MRERCFRNCKMTLGDKMKKCSSLYIFCQSLSFGSLILEFRKRL